MLERLGNLSREIDGVKAIGTVSKEDYELVFQPILDDARREGRRIKFVYQVGPEFRRFTAGAAWEDVRIGLDSLWLFDGCAIVSDVGWIRESARLVGFFMHCPVRTFGNDELEEAVDWLSSLPEAVGASHRLLPETGVIVVEVTSPLRGQDFEALAATVDPWIESHGELRGLVIHAHRFPGWENLGSLFRHVRFVHDHHRQVRRVALVSDSKLLSLAPRIAEHFVRAEVRQFGHEEIERAIVWAGEPLPRHESGSSPSD